jgi:hypothetical protein
MLGRVVVGMGTALGLRPTMWVMVVAWRSRR